jgi:hypothetical protein
VAPKVDRVPFRGVGVIAVCTSGSDQLSGLRQRFFGRDGSRPKRVAAGAADHELGNPASEPAPGLVDQVRGASALEARCADQRRRMLTGLVDPLVEGAKCSRKLVRRPAYSCRRRALDGYQRYVRQTVVDRPSLGTGSAVVAAADQKV